MRNKNNQGTLIDINNLSTYKNIKLVYIIIFKVSKYGYTESGIYIAIIVYFIILYLHK